MKKYINIHHLLLLPLLVVSSQSVFSCEFHEGGYGFGGSMTGRFNKWNSHSVDAAQTHLASTSSKWLTLTTPTMVLAKLNDKTEISIDYQKMTQVENFQLQLEAMSEILVVNAIQTETDSESGRYTFTVIPAKAGTFKLTTIAHADEQGRAKTTREVIYLNVKASG